MDIIPWDDFLKGGSFDEDTACAAGMFDGVHRGHAALLKNVRESGFLPIVVTFRNHPRGVLSPGNAPPLLTTLDERLSRFEAHGIRSVILIDFSPDFATLKGGAFLASLREYGRLRYMAVGPTFRCGSDRLGAEDIVRINGLAGVQTVIVPAELEGGLPVSSSRIRAALAAGDGLLAARMLDKDGGF
jgi:FAD synthase